MSSNVPQLFNSVKKPILRARAQAMGEARFLLDVLCQDLDLRLATLVRRFDHALDLGTPDAAFGQRAVASGMAQTQDWLSEPEAIFAHPYREARGADYGVADNGQVNRAAHGQSADIGAPAVGAVKGEATGGKTSIRKDYSPFLAAQDEPSADLAAGALLAAVQNRLDHLSEASSGGRDAKRHLLQDLRRQDQDHKDRERIQNPHRLPDLQRDQDLQERQDFERQISRARPYTLVVSGGALQAVDDLPGILTSIRQMLAPDGLFLAAFAGGDTLHELRTCLLEAELHARGAAGLRVFPMVDLRSLGALMQRAGFALPVIDSEKITVRYASVVALIRDVRAMASSAALLHRAGQPGLNRAIFAHACALYAQRFSDPDGRLRATFEIVWASGWSPHASQQQPLRPGSGSVSLHSVLKKKL